eukprot:944216_1
MLPLQSEQIKLDLNRSSVVKDDDYELDEIPIEEPKLMDRASKVIVNDNMDNMDNMDNIVPKMSRSRGSAKVPQSQYEIALNTQNKNKKRHKNRNKNNNNKQPQQQQYTNVNNNINNNINNSNKSSSQPQQYLNYNYQQNPTISSTPYLSSVPMTNNTTSAPPLARATTAPSASNTQLKQLENTVEQLRSHFVQLLQHLPLTATQQQQFNGQFNNQFNNQFNSVHQISNILASNPNTANNAANTTNYQQFTNSVNTPTNNSSYSTPNIGLSNVSATNLLNTNGANIVIKKNVNTTPSNVLFPQNIHNRYQQQQTSQPNMTNYAFPTISNPTALSSIPLSLTTNNPLVTQYNTNTVNTQYNTNTTNNPYLLQPNNITLSTPQTVQVPLYQNNTQT